MWCYTHAWKNVARKHWGQTSILASIESTKQAKKAMKKGYAPAIVVPTHISDKGYKLAGSDVTWIPCPQQTLGIACTDCGLCMNADGLLKSKRGIAFAIHGTGTKKALRKLEVVQ